MVAVHGELDIRLLRSMASDVAEAVKKFGCKRILNELRDAEATRTIETYNMPDTAKKAGVTELYKRALVVGDKAPDFIFLETVFVNRGHQVKMFTNIDDARDWLFDELAE